MKISKLFHWLYALVMLLPIFAIGSTCLISTFNMQSKQESRVTYKYDTNEVNNIADIRSGNIYEFDIDYFRNNIPSANTNICICNGYRIALNNGSLLTDFTTDTTVLYNTNGTFYVYTSNMPVSFSLSVLSEFSIVFNRFAVSSQLEDLNNYFTICRSELNFIQGVETYNLDTQDIFYNAIDKVKQSPLFNWAYDSFLVAPFAYIVSLFSMPANSFVVQMLSYWLAISIIWLVFDLVMYVPLLVHRWLDKGVLE